jgi:hypothetical protein
VLYSSVSSSFANEQNSVTFKPLVELGCICNRWKSRRVVQLFGIQLRGRTPRKQPQILFSFHRCNLSRLVVFSKPVIVQKVIEPELLIDCRQVNARWKSVDVLYLFGTLLSVRFQKE